MCGGGGEDLQVDEGEGPDSNRSMERKKSERTGGRRGDGGLVKVKRDPFRPLFIFRPD